jgi:hypothetical protein
MGIGAGSCLLAIGTAVVPAALPMGNTRCGFAQPRREAGGRGSVQSVEGNLREDRAERDAENGQHQYSPGGILCFHRDSIAHFGFLSDGSFWRRRENLLFRITRRDIRTGVSSMTIGGYSQADRFGVGGSHIYFLAGTRQMHLTNARGTVGVTLRAFDPCRRIIRLDTLETATTLLALGT